MPVEPSLIGADGTRQERGTDGCNRDLGDQTRSETVGMARWRQVLNNGIP